MNKIRRYLSYCRARFSHQECIFLGLLAAVAVLATPLQHYIPLSRLQHYSFGVFAIAVGFLLQTVISWRTVTIWGRLTFFSSFLYLATFSTIFYNNPWLDPHEGMETHSQKRERRIYSAYLAFAGVPLAYIWTRWAIDRMRQAEQNNNEPTAEING